MTEAGATWIAPHHAAALNTNIQFVLMWWFGSLGFDDFVNSEKTQKLSNPVNNEIVGNKETKFKSTMLHEAPKLHENTFCAI